MKVQFISLIKITIVSFVVIVIQRENPEKQTVEIFNCTCQNVVFRQHRSTSPHRNKSYHSMNTNDWKPVAHRLNTCCIWPAKNRQGTTEKTLNFLERN
jgi:uncharacterized C2H2 Zn-finger protein